MIKRNQKVVIVGAGPGGLEGLGIVGAKDELSFTADATGSAPLAFRASAIVATAAVNERSLSFILVVSF